MSESEKIIPLRRMRRDDDGSDATPPPDDHLPSGCPVEPVGYEGGQFWFISHGREPRRLSDRQLCSKPGLAGLFMGDVSWLEKNFPSVQMRIVTVGGESVAQEHKSGFDAQRSGAALMRACHRAGFYGPHIVTRKPGIWRGADGAPVVHVGDRLLSNGTWYRAGQRIGDIIWAIGARETEPAEPCDTGPGRALLDGLRANWNWASDGGPVVLAGLIAVGYYGAAADWRPSGYIAAGAEAGKTMLLQAAAACWPMHAFTNDGSAAGITGSINGRALPVVIDEAGDRDPEAARRVADLLLASASGDGIRQVRGNPDGTSRSSTAAASFLMGSVGTPALGPTHLGRISIIELRPAAPGSHGREAMQAFEASMREVAPALWGRALARFQDWRSAMRAFAEGLRRYGCTPRGIDQMSAILAGWWVLTQDAAPTAIDVRAGIAAVADFVRVTEEVREADTPRQVADYLMTRQVQMGGTTLRETVGTLLQRAWEVESLSAPEQDDARTAITVLARYGIRPVRRWEVEDQRSGKAVPRMGADCDAVWLLPAAVNGMFAGSPWDAASRWLVEIKRLPSAAQARFNVRVGGSSGKAVWVRREDFDRAEPIAFADLCERLRIEPARILGLMDRYGPQFPVATQDGDYRYWTFDLSRVTAFLERQENADDG